MPLHLLENANPITGIIWVVAVNDLSGHVLKVSEKTTGSRFSVAIEYLTRALS